MKGVIIFLSGVAVGALGTAIWTMKKLVPEMREEAAREARESMREIPDYSMYLTDEEDTEDSGKEEEPAADDVPAPAPSEVKKAVQENREAPKVDYSRYSDKKKAERKTEKKESADNSEEQEPFVITPSEFNIRGGYLAKAYSIYQNNVIIDDDSDEMVDINPLDVFGKTAMEELKKEGIVYVQDDANKRYYRVEEMECDYEGPDPEDEDDYWRR